MSYENEEDGLLSVSDRRPTGLSAYLTQRNIWIAIAAGLMIIIAGVLATVVALAIMDSDDDKKTLLWDAVKINNVMNHLREFEEIAKEHGNSRSVADGYNASADYVLTKLKVLEEAGYCTISIQPFIVPLYTELKTPRLSLPTQTTPSNVSITGFTYQYDGDFLGMRYGGNSTVNSTHPVFIVPNYGCNESDFTNFPENAIALVKDTGGCTVYNKALNAQNAKASAVFVSNPITRTRFLNPRARTVNWKIEDAMIQIPSLSVSYSTGETLREYGNGALVHMEVSNKVELANTFNVLCTMNHGKETDTVMIGAHLDSVPEGPGINDNGSGSAMILEILTTMRKNNYKPKNRIRFAWWGAEEIGLLGSRYYVDYMKEHEPAEWANVALYINMDMMASPNFIPMIHNATTAPENVRNASLAIQKSLENFFSTYLKKPSALTPMIVGSDFVPFSENGIPAGGMAAGAGGLKSMEEREVFGGMANAPLDSCYHLPCDTVANINVDSLTQFTKAATYALKTLSDQNNLREYLGPVTKASTVARALVDEEQDSR